MTEKERAAFEKFKADYNELCHLKDMKIAILEEKLAENIKDYTKLQLENAELKEELKDANKKVVHLACNQNKDLKRKNNKAKEIIKNLMVFAEMDDREYEKEYKEAEQFLKEE